MRVKVKGGGRVGRVQFREKTYFRFKIFYLITVQLEHQNLILTHHFCHAHLLAHQNYNYTMLYESC